ERAKTCGQGRCLTQAPTESVLSVSEDRLHHDRTHRGHGDADEQRAPHLADVERDADEQTEDEDHDRPPVQAAVTELDGRSVTGLDKTRVEQADEGQEQTDTNGDGDLETRRYRGEHSGTKACE